MITKYILGAAGVSILVLGGLYTYERMRRIEAQDQVLSLKNSIRVLERQAEQNQLARDVEAARAEYWQGRNKELTATIEKLREIPDVPLDPRIIDLLDGLRHND